MEISLECVLKTKEHASLLHSWRSDDEARAMSLHSTPKTEEEFWQHYCHSYFALKDLPSVFARVDGKRVAFVGFDPMSQAERKAALISIVVEPSSRGKGIGSEILQAINQFARQQGYEELFAEIKPQNSASKHIFEKAGFKRVKEIKKQILDDKKVQDVAIELYRLELCLQVPPQKVFIIAEAGSNWRMGNYARDLKLSRTLIELAKEAGCDAIKFQVFRADTVYVPNAGSADYMSEMGIQESVQEVFEDISMPYEMIPELAKMCEEVGIEFMSTPFSKQDFMAVDPYVKRHKIGSYEIGHIRLLELAAKSGKPLLLSTGVSEVVDIEWAVHFYKTCGGRDLTLLQCCAQYPASSSGMNLRAIPWMNAHFALPVGLSDHSPDPIVAPVAAVSLGACVVEKHFTLDKRMPGPDHCFAVEPHELKAMCAAIRTCEQMRGTGVKEVLKEEMELFHFARRSVQATSNIKKGERFVEDQNIAILRPGKQKAGVAPRYIDEIVGKTAKRDITLGEGVQFDDWT